MHKGAAIVLVTVCLVVAVSHAQTPGGSLRGIVEDGRGARIASAAIAFALNASSIERTVYCDGRGNFRIDDLSREPTGSA